MDCGTQWPEASRGAPCPLCARLPFSRCSDGGVASAAAAALTSAAAAAAAAAAGGASCPRQLPRLRPRPSASAQLPPGQDLTRLCAMHPAVPASSLPPIPAHPHAPTPHTLAAPRRCQWRQRRRQQKRPQQQQHHVHRTAIHIRQGRAPVLVAHCGIRLRGDRW